MTSPIPNPIVFREVVQQTRIILKTQKPDFIRILLVPTLISSLLFSLWEKDSVKFFLGILPVPEAAQSLSIALKMMAINSIAFLLQLVTLSLIMRSSLGQLPNRPLWQHFIPNRFAWRLFINQIKILLIGILCGLVVGLLLAFVLGFIGGFFGYFFSSNPESLRLIGYIFGFIGGAGFGVWIIFRLLMLLPASQDELAIPLTLKEAYKLAGRYRIVSLLLGRFLLLLVLIIIIVISFTVIISFLTKQSTYFMEGYLPLLFFNLLYWTFNYVVTLIYGSILAAVYQLVKQREAAHLAPA